MFLFSVSTTQIYVGTIEMFFIFMFRVQKNKQNEYNK